MLAVAEYEAQYVVLVGYWAALHHSTIDLPQERVKEGKVDDANLLEDWAFLAVRYSLSVLGLRMEFYRIASGDPTHSKLVHPILKKRAHVAHAEDLKKALTDMMSHSTTNMMKAVPNLQASSTTRRATRPGGPAGDG